MEGAPSFQKSYPSPLNLFWLKVENGRHQERSEVLLPLQDVFQEVFGLVKYAESASRPALKFCTRFLPSRLVMAQATVGVYCQA